MEPKLSLSYSSQAGNGLLGAGWSLGGLGGVGRCPRTMAQDGVRGAVNYDANDRYCLDGQRLIAISGSEGGDGTEYRTERESFAKIVSYGSAGNGPSWFKVWTKAGQVMEYGRTTDARIEAVKAAGSNAAWPAGTVSIWSLNKITDVKGNYISVTYTKDAQNGDYVPLRIDYTGNVTSGSAPHSSVQFSYESRPDNTVFYQASAQMRSMSRLTKVKLFSDSTQTKEYQFQYSQSSSTFRSLLSSVKECTPDGVCLPPLTFSYQRGADGSFVGQTPFNFGTDINSWDPMYWTYGDFNGDGKLDIIQ
ncbi:virulence plasmid B protein, partial [Herbaspirillum sp. CF444]